MKMFPITLLALTLAGCASPEYVARQSNWDVCRLSMGGPHSQAAELEARARGLDCAPYYGAIQQQLINQNAAVQQFNNAINPPVQPGASCVSQRVGDTVRTVCR